LLAVPSMVSDSLWQPDPAGMKVSGSLAATACGVVDGVRQHRVHQAR
jgi:hypothetical protein